MNPKQRREIKDWYTDLALGRTIKAEDIERPAAELARREQAAGVAGCPVCGFGFRSTNTSSLEKGECAKCGADWPLHGKREQAQAPQHTPGTWHYTEARIMGSKGWVVRQTKTDDDICLVHPSHEGTEANAALIARAPDLLAENERLKESVDWDVVNALAEKDEYKREIAAFLADNARLRSLLARISDAANGCGPALARISEICDMIKAAKEATE